jgi:hypothetical protein
VTIWSRLSRSSWRPGPGARAWRGLQHSDVAPGPDGGSSPVTFYGSHCLSKVGLIRVGCSPLAAGRLCPSQWRRGVRIVPWWKRMRPRRYADCGQLMAGSTSRPARLSQYRFRPAGRTVTATVGRNTRWRWAPGHRPGRRGGFPRRPGGPGCCSPAESAGLRASGAVEWRQAYMGSWGNLLPAAGPGRQNVAVQPAVGGLSTLGSPGDPSVGVQVGLLIPKTTT